MKLKELEQEESNVRRIIPGHTSPSPPRNKLASTNFFLFSSKLLASMLNTQEPQYSLKNIYKKNH
jgi:ADP-glucose pyrophosphorylase